MHLIQREMFGHRERHCRECGVRFLPLHPDALTQSAWDDDDGTLWAQTMNFCSRYCLRAYHSYHEYLCPDDDEEGYL